MTAASVNIFMKVNQSVIASCLESQPIGGRFIPLNILLRMSSTHSTSVTNTKCTFMSNTNYVSKTDITVVLPL